MMSSLVGGVFISEAQTFFVVELAACECSIPSAYPDCCCSWQLRLMLFLGFLYQQPAVLADAARGNESLARLTYQITNNCCAATARSTLSTATREQTAHHFMFTARIINCQASANIHEFLACDV